jgi:alpha-1,2-mannosyltransferase
VWALRRAPTIAFLAVAPVLYVLAIAVLGVADAARPLDFATFWDSGHAVLHGDSPYPALASLPRVADRTKFVPFVYPPPAAVAMAPLSLVPFALACVVWLLVSVAAACAALRLLGVRDWRCYGATVISMPMISALGVGALGPFLLLGVAVAWRWRERALVAGIAVAAVMIAKLFLWPLGLWLLFTRRFRAAAIAALGALASTVGAWALIGFAGARGYPSLLGRLTDLVGVNSFSVYALERTLGVGDGIAQAAPLVAAVALVAALRKRDDQTLLIGALGAALLATPVLWPHYLVLLAVPLALRSPRLNAMWLAPEVLWLNGVSWSYGSVVRILPELAVAFVVVYPRSVSRTSSACVSGFTLCMTRLTLPSAPITNVERSTPM